MHMYILARGIKDRLDRFVNDLLARYYPYRYDPKKPKGKVQLAVRPVMLYELVFPKESYKDVLNLVQPGQGNKRPREKKFLWTLRKILGIKKIPDKDFKNIKPNTDIYRAMVGILGIGIKDDPVENGIELL